MRAALLLVLTLLAGCAGSQRELSEPDEPGPEPERGPGSIRLTVELPPRDGSPSTELWLRDPAGEVEFGFLGGGTTKDYTGLAPGTYDVAAKIACEHDGPWIYVEDRVEVRAGGRTEVSLALPRNRTAGFAIVPEEGTPPLYLVLAREGTVFPHLLRPLGRRLSQQSYPDDLRFALQSDGRSHLDAIPPLEAGHYVLLWVANDWQSGDPPILPRSIEIELVADRTTTLHLADQLTRWRVE